MRKIALLTVALMFLTVFIGSPVWAADNDSTLQKYRNQYQALYGGEKGNTTDSSNIGKFIDTRYHWGGNSIERIATLGLLKGYADGTFKPNNNVTQEEMLAIVMRLVDDNNVTTSDYNQKLSTLPKWAKESVQGAVNNGFININRFQANTPASRAITCVAFAKMLGLKEVSVDRVKFTDKNQIESGDLGYILAMYEAKYVTGTADNQFKPNNNITRAEMAVILERILALPPEPTPQPVNLSALGDNLTNQFNTIGIIRVNKITLTGDTYNIDAKISVNSGSNTQSDWDDLLYADILDWVDKFCTSVQNQTAKYTKIKGHLVNENTNDVLFSFTKDGEKDTEGSYGNRYDVNETVKDLQGEKYRIAEITFQITDITYNTYDGKINVSLKAQGAVTSAKWSELANIPGSNNDVEKGVKHICTDLTNIFAKNAGANPQFINVYLYKFESYTLLDRYAYDAVEGKLN